MPLAVSTCGAKTTAGFTLAMVDTTSSIGAGAQGDCASPPVRRAFSTVMFSGAVMRPVSRIWLQRKLKKPLRIITTRWSPANWRATDSMPKVPLPGTSTAASAWYTSFSIAAMSFITP
jgi:hypothetical protein